MNKPATAATAPKTEATTTKPTDAAVRAVNAGGNGSASTSQASADNADGDVPELTEAPQPGKRPLTVVVSEKTYRNLRVLAASEGTSVSAVVVEAVEASTAAKLRAALTALAKDLG